MMMSARYFGLDLDPNEFRMGPGDTIPTAAALSAWAQNTGMWSRALRLRWRHLFTVGGNGPVILLFNDGSAGLLVGANAEQKIVLIRDPRAAEADPPVPVDEMRLSEVWSGEAVLLRAERSQAEADPPFTLRWLASVVLKEKKHLRDLIIGSFAISMLTIFPPLLVMQVVDRVLTHHSYSTLFLISMILLTTVTYETLLGYARRLIILVIGVRTDAKLSLHVFNRLIRLPLDYFERHPAGETMYKVSQVNKVREFMTGKLMTTLLDMITLLVLLPLLFWLNATLAWFVLVCATLIMLIILAFLRPIRHRLRQGGQRRSAEERRARRDDLRHQDGEVAGAGAAAQVALGRTDRRGRQVALRHGPAVELAADAGHADRAVHVDGRHPGRRLPRPDR